MPEQSYVAMGPDPGMHPQYNNVATSSFYSHLPFGNSGYMNSFGTPLIPSGMHPMDMMGYGSHTINFNRPSNMNVPTYYSEAFYPPVPHS
jgi:hypothetical protein